MHTANKKLQEMRMARCMNWISKETWIKERCQEIEEDMLANKIDGAFQKIEQNFRG